MVSVLKFDNQLADEVEKELFSIRVRWQYYSITTDYYNKGASEQEKNNIDFLREKYGPVIDTQRFSYVIHTDANKRHFFEIRKDPNSYYRKNFPYTAKLVDLVQENYIPKKYHVFRLMANIQTIRPQWSMNSIHPDTRTQGAYTVLYYVNDSDGDTYFFDKRECVAKIPPVKGTAAIYPSTLFHAGSTPIKHETRVVLNMVFSPNK